MNEQQLLRIADRISAAKDYFDGEEVSSAAVFYAVLSAVAEAFRDEAKAESAPPTL